MLAFAVRKKQKKCPSCALRMPGHGRRGPSWPARSRHAVPSSPRSNFRSSAFLFELGAFRRSVWGLAFPFGSDCVSSLAGCLRFVSPAACLFAWLGVVAGSTAARPPTTAPSAFFRAVFACRRRCIFAARVGRVLSFRFVVKSDERDFLAGQFFDCRDILAILGRHQRICMPLAPSAPRSSDSVHIIVGGRWYCRS